MNGIDRYTCEETFRRLEDYLDRQLTPEENRLVEAHLQECVRCATEFQFEAGLLSDIRAKLTRIQVPTTFRSRLAELLQEERRKQA